MAMTHAAELAKQYRDLGGSRLAKMDDNVISTRQWDDEPAEATAFWQKNVEPLSDREQAEVVSHLKSLNS